MKHLASYFRMKKILIAFWGCVFCFAFSSCNDEETYADQLKREKELISNYIKRNNIKVISTAPSSDTAWETDQYINPEGNMYFNLLKAGTGTDSIEVGDIALVRFKSYTLGETPDSIINWDVIHYPSVPEFVYGNSAEACTAWHIALSYMKRMDAEAQVIVPSKMGFTSQTANPYWGVMDDESSSTPRVYILKIKFRK